MEENNRRPSLLVRADETQYALFTEEDSLVILRLRPGETPENAEFREGRGSRRIPKEEIEGIRCTVNGAETALVIARGGRVRRFVCDRAAEESELKAVFGGIPLKISAPARSRSALPGKQGLERGLLAACFAAGALRLVCSWIPALRPAAQLWPLVWIAVALIWIAVCSGRGGDAGSRTETELCGLPVNAGMLSWILSSLLLWTAHEGEVVRWTKLILPTLGMMLPAAVCLGAAAKRLRPAQMLLIAMVSVFSFAPATAAYLNELLPERSVAKMPLAVMELTQEYTRGADHYYAVAELEGVQGIYEITREESLILKDGGSLMLVQTTGALGVEYSRLECREAAPVEPSAGAEPAE